MQKTKMARSLVAVTHTHTHTQVYLINDKIIKHIKKQD